MVVIGIARFRDQGRKGDPTKHLHVSPEESLTIADGFKSGQNQDDF